MIGFFYRKHFNFIGEKDIKIKIRPIIMEIYNVPSHFQPEYSKKNIEEIIFDIIKYMNNSNFKTEYIYLPIFWTSYYILHDYGDRSGELATWINSLDKSKKYFTVVQYDSGIYVKNYDIDIMVFTASGGGLNIGIGDLDADPCMCKVKFNDTVRTVFCGNKGSYDIPLLCLPEIPFLNLERDIYCSFMGRMDTHTLRMEIRDTLQNNNEFKFWETVDYETYKQILNRSIFSLAPRGFGYTSFRLYEAIAANSIPIFVWEDKICLPFDDEIDWTEFSIVIHISQIRDLENILKNVNIPKMQQQLAQIKHVFTFNYTTDYIIQKISSK
jgi:hypothetical protein